MTAKVLDFQPPAVRTGSELAAVLPCFASSLAAHGVEIVEVVLEGAGR